MGGPGLRESVLRLASIGPPRVLSESAINEILFALDNGGGADLVRELAELGMQGLIEAEATEVIGAERWERTVDRSFPGA